MSRQHLENVQCKNCGKWLLSPGIHTCYDQKAEDAACCKATKATKATKAHLCVVPNIEFIDEKRLIQLREVRETLQARRTSKDADKRNSN